SGVMIEFCDRVGLRQVLRSVAYILNHSEVGLQNCILIFIAGRETELITERGTPRCCIASHGNVNLIKHVRIEIVFVRSDAWLLEGINAERGYEGFDSVLILHKGIYVGGVGRGIQRDQRRVHMTGGPGGSV